MVSDLSFSSGSSFIAQNIRNNIQEISARINSGRRVNTIADNAINFTQSASFLSRANTLNTVLDGLNNSVQTVNSAKNVLNTLSSRLSQANELVTASRLALINGTTDPNIAFGPNPPSLSDIIQADSPVAYYQLNSDATNLGSASGIDGININGTTFDGDALYTFNGTNSASFNGTNQGIRIPDSASINTTVQAQRTVELVFNADTVSGRQVLFEEGGATNGLTLYIDDGRFYGTGRDQGSFNYSFSQAITAGQTYQAAFVFDNVDSNSFSVYLNGQQIGSGAVSQNFASHSGDIGIGFAPDTARYFDGSPNARNYFDGRISDVAIYNDALSQADLTARYEAVTTNGPVGDNFAYDSLVQGLRNIADDAYFKGQNILLGDSINTRLNEGNTSQLTTDALDVSNDALDLIDGNFNDLGEIVRVLNNIEDAQDLVADYIRSLDTDLDVLTSRVDFTTDNISNLEGGSNDLVGADVSEDQALLLAEQSRLAVAEASYSLAASFRNSLANDFLLGATSNRSGSSFFSSIA